MMQRARALGAIFSFVCFVAIAVMVGVAALNNQNFRVGSASASAAEVQVAAAPALSAPQSAPATTAASAPAAPAAPTQQAAPQVIRDRPPLQCAIYARERTGISLTGAARTWWPQAEGRYRRTHQPQVGAVMAMLGTPSGHVAVVARIINSREILIDHANWMNQGEIILGAQVVDVSEANDWSRVRVWHPPTNSLGLTPYPVQGFILPDAA